MTIVSNYPNLDHIYSETISQLSNLINPKHLSFDINNFADIIETIDKTSRELALSLVQQTLEDMDDAFFNSTERIRDFYVKVRRSRMLITVFGQVTFTRRIYQSKLDGRCFTYVDRKVGLPRYDRYDPTVKAKVVEAYADNNSMIKVGQIIGEQMMTSFSRDSNRKHFSLSRQTVHNIVKSTHKLYPKVNRYHTTPKTIYMMADEKYIPIQKLDKNRAMLKHCVLFEGVRVKGKRVTLINKLSFSSLEHKFWEHIHDFLVHVYDFDKIERIILMGDGASWIKAGAGELPKATFILDKFHTFQAVSALTRNEIIRYNLRESIITNDFTTFKELIEVLKIKHEDDGSRLDTIKEKAKYLINHWDSIQRAHKAELPGCSMEAQISHNIASVFSSRPKAYALKNLEIYMSTRDLHLNGVDIIHAYLNTLTYKTSSKPQPIEKEVLDLSIFDPRPSYDKSSTSNWLKGFISKQ